MGGNEAMLTLARTAELDWSIFAEMIASLLQVISQISHAPYAQVCYDFSGDFACIGYARSGSSHCCISSHGGVA